MAGKNIYLLGGNGAPNFGDELMAKAWLDHLSERFPDARITLDCNNADAPMDFFGLDGERARSISGIKIFCNTHVKNRFAGVKNASDRFLACVKYGLGFLSSGAYAEFSQLEEALGEIEDAGAFHIFGGGYINTGIRPDSGFLIGFAAAAKRQFGGKLFATGAGITPLRFDGQESTAPFVEALAEFDLFECRDSYGYDKLFDLTNNRANLINGVDDTYLLRFAPSAAERAPRRLHLCFHRQELSPDLRGVLKEVRSIAETFDEVTYWNCVPGFLDRNLQHFRRAIPRLRIIDCYDLVHRTIPAGPGDYVITQRFHPHLIAARMGCTGVFVQEGQYYRDKHRSVVHLGSDFKKYMPGVIDPTSTAQRAGILERDEENMARKARIREACYGGAPA